MYMYRKSSPITEDGSRSAALQWSVETSADYRRWYQVRHHLKIIEIRIIMVTVIIILILPKLSPYFFTVYHLPVIVQIFLYFPISIMFACYFVQTFLYCSCYDNFCRLPAAILNRRIQFIVLISIIFTGYIVQTFAICLLATFVKLSVSGHHKVNFCHQHGQHIRINVNYCHDICQQNRDVTDEFLRQRLFQVLVQTVQDKDKLHNVRFKIEKWLCGRNARNFSPFELITLGCTLKFILDTGVGKYFGVRGSFSFSGDIGWIVDLIDWLIGVLRQL